MGEIDIDNVNKIYRACIDFCKIAGLPFQFKEDSGHMETAIIISEYGNVYTPDRIELDVSFLKTGESQCRKFVPDVMDIHNKIIVEFEETPGKPRLGARLAKKGHDPDGNDLRTSWRDLYYGIGKFRLLKIFDYEFADETKWKIKLFRFLMDCFENKVEIAA